MRFVQNDGRIHPALITLAKKYGIGDANGMSPQQLSSAMQATWIQRGKLRFEISGEPPKGDDLELLDKLGCIKDVGPTPTGDKTWDPELNIDPPSYATYHYEGVLILGALYARVVSRLHYFLSLCHRLIDGPEETDRLRFGKIYLLGGARPLDPVKESRELLCTPTELPLKAEWTTPEQMPTTEAEMMAFAWNQSHLAFSPKYGAVKHELVDTPLQPKDPQNPNGEKRPPNTGDTVRDWITKHSPNQGLYLVVSNQPFIEYQQLVLERLIPKGFTVYTCGPKSSLTLPLSAYLDNCAKQMFEELQVKQ